MRRWAERATAPFENWLWADMPRWAWFLIFYLRPRPTLGCLREWFRQVTVLPGDEWDCLFTDRRLIVREVKPRRVTCEVASWQMIRRAPDWPERVPPGCVRCYEGFARTPFGWWVR